MIQSRLNSGYMSEAKLAFGSAQGLRERGSIRSWWNFHISKITGNTYRSLTASNGTNSGNRYG